MSFTRYSMHALPYFVLTHPFPSTPISYPPGQCSLPPSGSSYRSPPCFHSVFHYPLFPLLLPRTSSFVCCPFWFHCPPPCPPPFKSLSCIGEKTHRLVFLSLFYLLNTMTSSFTCSSERVMLSFFCMMKKNSLCICTTASYPPRH